MTVAAGADQTTSTGRATSTGHEGGHPLGEHALPCAANCSILFTEVPLLERAAAAADAGFAAVEFWWPFDVATPADHDLDAFAASVADAGVALVGLNFFAGDMPGGDRGLVSWPARCREFRDNVEVALGLGQRLGCTAFNALYGNRVDDASPDEQDELGAENLVLAAAAARARGATVLVEPVSGAPRYPLTTAGDAVAVIERVERAGRDGADAARSGPSGIGLLLDLYHCAVGGDDLVAVVDEHAGRIAHVQVADAPGRGEPGSGDLPLAGALERLAAAGYAGHVGLEYKPTTTTLESLAWLPRERRGAHLPSRGGDPVGSPAAPRDGATS